MTEIAFKDGKPLFQDGKVASGSGCCCQKCSGPCDGENPCPEGCVCVDGQCVAAGVCCLPDGTCSSGGTQEECENCTTINTCYEYLYLEDPEAGCPEGWAPDGFGGCSRVTNPTTCDQCSGWCDSQQSGTCGTWQGDVGCDRALCECVGMEDEEQLIVEINPLTCDQAGLDAWVEFLESNGWTSVRYGAGDFGTTAYFGLCCGPWSFESNAPAGTNGYLCGGAPAGQMYRVCANPLPEWFTNPLP